MKEIKFRIWDKKNKHWAGFNDVIPTLNCDRDHTPWIWSLTNKDNRAFFEFSQYTGLKDKNGKEIYEGDILQFSKKYPSHPAYKGMVAKVVYDQSAFVLDSGDGNMWFLSSEEKLKTSPEVIGNIYENPGLVAKEE